MFIVTGLICHLKKATSSLYNWIALSLFIILLSCLCGAMTVRTPGLFEVKFTYFKPHIRNCGIKYHRAISTLTVTDIQHVDIH